MAYRNKVYTIFDADNDMNWYKTLKMWEANDKFEFSFNNAHDLNSIRVMTEENIKRNLRERMSNTKVALVLVGEKTKNLFKFVRWEMEVALKKDVPIIAVNLNKVNGIDTSLCPPILRDEPVVHIPFTQAAMVHALKNWPGYYHNTAKKAENNKGYYYKQFDT